MASGAITVAETTPLVTGAPVRGFLFTAGIGFCVFLLAFWPGVAPPPIPSPSALPGKLLLALPLGLGLWAAAVRDLFRRTRG